jgi:hypothetical protein
LRRTNGQAAAVNALLKRIEQKRGKEAAEVLRQDMRIAYQAARQIAGPAATGAARDVESG